MSEASTDKKTAQKKGSFACAEEAAALLNCVADKKYNDMRCIPLMKKLRVCIEKKNVVDFKLLPDEETSS